MLRLRSASTTFELTDFHIPTGSLTINLGAGNNTLTVSSAPQLTAALTINGSTGDDTINLNADISFAVDKSLDVNLQDDGGAAGIDTINVGADANLILSGSGAATLTASKNISLASASSVTTVNGSLELKANQQTAPTAGAFVGVYIDNGVIQAIGIGAVTVKGKGGNDSGGSQIGVQVRGGGDIIGGTSGLLTVEGNGGTPGGDTNYGIRVTGTGSTITSGGAVPSPTPHITFRSPRLRAAAARSS